MIDTPGFGEAVDNTECWTPILDYVEDQFDGYLEAETRVERVEVGDIDDDDNDDDDDHIDNNTDDNHNEYEEFDKHDQFFTFLLSHY